MRKISTARSSRRAPPLKDSDYDHEINLVDHAAEAANPQAITPEPPLEPPAEAPSEPTASEEVEDPESDLSPRSTLDAGQNLSKYTTAVQSYAPGTPALQAGPSTTTREPSPCRSTNSHRSTSTSVDSSGKAKKARRTLKGSSLRRASRGRVTVPKVTVNEPTPLGDRRLPTPNGNSRGVRNAPETVIDVLYENQRGGFLCGIPLFSPKALGQLDPTPWTNIVHKPSPTDITTAQVPDPSWGWAWPEWRVNHDEGVDEDGWEYSFMFAKAFSWHRPKWYNSFVRRRAWVRKRIKRNVDPNDPHWLNTDYFTIRPSGETARSGSKASSHRSMSTGSSGVVDEKADIGNIDTLMGVLGRSRIDREKIEAVENFLEHDDEELKHLEHRMHDIMANFVFQASRKVLLAKLNEVYEKAQQELKEQDTSRLQRRCDNLKAAIRHADEECRALEYWSDTKSLIQEGKVKTATDKCKGWDGGWQGVHSSGAIQPDTFNNRK